MIPRGELAHLFRGAYSLMTSAAITAALGVVFWAVAARTFSTETLGQDAALITAMITLSTICQLNLGNALVRFLPPMREGAPRVLALAYLLSAAVSAVVALAFVAGMPLLSPRFDFLTADVATAVGFPLGVALWSVFVLQDAALAALRRAPLVPVENAAFGLLKLAALPLFAGMLAHGVFLAWVVGMALLLVPVNVYIFRTALPAHRRQSETTPEPGISDRRGVIRFLVQDYLAMVLNVGAVTILPLIVVGVLGSRQNAYFFMPFSIMLAIELFMLSAATSLLAEGARAHSRGPDLTRALVRRIGPVVVVGLGALVAAAPLVLLPFGAEYAEHGAPVLRLLALATLLHAVTILFVTVSRLRRSGGRILAVYLGWFALGIGLVYGFAHAGGITGVALAWLLANAVVALAVTPSLLRYVRRAGDSTPLPGRPRLPFRWRSSRSAFP